MSNLAEEIVVRLEGLVVVVRRAPADDPQVEVKDVTPDDDEQSRAIDEALGL